MGKRTENVGFSVCKTLVNVSKMPRFPSIQPSFSRTVNASFFAVISIYVCRFRRGLRQFRVIPHVK